MVNHFLNRAANRDKQSKGYHRSKKQEKDLAKRVGGFTTPGSGAGFTATRAGQVSRPHKGDVYVPNLVRLEAKTTQNKSFSVTRDMYEKIALASIGKNEIPGIIVEFLDAMGKPEAELAVIKVSDLEALIHAAKEAAKTR